MARAIDANELEMFPYAEVAGTEEQIADWIEQVGLSGDDTASRARNLCWKVIEGFINVVKTQPTLTPPNEPLTIEQLRQMEKPTPVWAKPEKKTIEAWDGYWCICHRGHIITPGMVSMYADKMNGVTFYAYPPTHIDLEAWEPCELCCRLGEVNPCYKDGCFKENVPKCDFRCDKFLDWRADTKKLAGAMFCPKCGRPLTPEARAMLEKRLRGCME